MLSRLRVRQLPPLGLPLARAAAAPPNTAHVSAPTTSADAGIFSHRLPLVSVNHPQTIHQNHFQHSLLHQDSCGANFMQGQVRLQLGSALERSHATASTTAPNLASRCAEYSSTNPGPTGSWLSPGWFPSAAICPVEDGTSHAGRVHL